MTAQTLYSFKADGTWQEQDRRKRLVKFFKDINPSRLRDVDSMLQRYQGREAILFKRIEAKYEKRIPLIIKKHTVELPKKKFKSRLVVTLLWIAPCLLSSSEHPISSHRMTLRKWNPKRLIEQRLLADDYDFYTDTKLQRKINLPAIEQNPPKTASPRRWVPPGSPEPRPQELRRVD